MSPVITHSENGKFPVVESLDDLRAHLHDIFESDHINVEHVESVMKSYKSNPLDWKNFAKFDQYRYTRNLVDEGNGKFNLMIVCWGEGHGSAVHDHSDAHCFMKILQGSLSEVRFAWPKDEDNSLQEISRHTLQSNEICYINDSLGLHRVENPSHSERAVSLHLYCPPFNSCKMFDQKTGHSTKCQVTFWSKFGERTSYGPGMAPSCVQPEDN